MSSLAKVGLVVALATAAACHHDAAPPAAPADVPPLPPSSGTPIGYLLDDTAVLQLHGDQRAQLQEIDKSLAAKLEAIDAQLRVATRPVETESTPPVRGGGRHGGRHGGMGGGGSPSGGGHHSRGGGSGSASAGSHAADADRLTEARATDVRDALESAFAVLDEGQRAAATKLLSDCGIDLDAGRPTATPGSAAAAEPAPTSDEAGH